MPQPTITVTFLNGNSTTNSFKGEYATWFCACGVSLHSKGYETSHKECPACKKKYFIQRDEKKRVVSVVEE